MELIAPTSQPVDGNWVFWGTAVGAAPWVLPVSIPIKAAGISWTDPSPVKGGHDLLPRYSDGGLVISGRTDDGQEWCGAAYFPDPYNGQDALGTLPPGCGLTGQWTVWLQGVDGGVAPSTAFLTQVRGSVVGYTDGGLNVTGTVGLNPNWNATNGLPILQVTGTWSAPGDAGGGFTWYPAGDGGLFSGNLDGAGWCGSLNPAIEPNPCQM